MRGIHVYPGFNKNILKALQQVSSAPTNSELCAVVFDETTIKENITYYKERDHVEASKTLGVLGGQTM